MNIDEVARHLVDAIQCGTADAYDIVGFAQAVAGDYLADYVGEADWLESYRKD